VTQRTRRGGRWTVSVARSRAGRRAHASSHVRENRFGLYECSVATRVGTPTCQEMARVDRGRLRGAAHPCGHRFCVTRDCPLVRSPDMSATRPPMSYQSVRPLLAACLAVSLSFIADAAPGGGAPNVHSALLLPDSSVWTAGQNYNGELGGGSREPCAAEEEGQGRSADSADSCRVHGAVNASGPNHPYAVCPQ
jgi:hypothetical protein